MFKDKPKLEISQKKLLLTTETLSDHLQFAYDIFCNEEKIKFINYSEKNKIEFDISDYQGIFKVWVFIKDNNNQVVSQFSNSVFLFHDNALKYEDLNKDQLTTGAKLFDFDAFKLPCLYFKKIKEVKHLTVLLSAFVDRDKQSIPVFNRWSWEKKFPGDVLCIADPTLELDDKLFIGWYLGTEKHDIAFDIVKLVKKIADLKQIPYSNIVFYGSSAGGFAALKLAQMVEGSTAVAVNPQVDATLHYEEYVNHLLDVSFGKQSKEDVKNKYDERFSMIKAWENNTKSKIIYVQNKQDAFHYDEHFIPFADAIGLSKVTGANSDKKYYTFLYDDVSGHGPEPENLIPEIINKIKEFTFLPIKDSWIPYVYKDYKQIAIEIDKCKFELDNLTIQELNQFDISKFVPMKFIVNIINMINKNDIVNTAGLIKGELNIPNYGVHIIGKPIDWDYVLKQEDNFKWYIHSWFHHKYYILGYKEFREDVYLDALIEDITLWKEKFQKNVDQKDFAWNDHSTANRLKHLSETFIFLSYQNLMTLEVFKILVETAYLHIMVLMQESFYSKGTNHGIDQAFSLLVGSSVFAFFGEFTEELAETSIDRLKYEFSSAFTDESIHVENSPEYHDVIFSSALTINNFVHMLTEKSILKKPLNEFISEALEYLAYIIRPDGLMPTIGDTELKSPRYIFDYLKEYPNYDAFLYKRTIGKEGVFSLAYSKVFSKSGYAICHGPSTAQNLNEMIHIVIKCGFQSLYHRQDDDNNIIVYAFDEDWLVDGGLYKHDHLDELRIYFRSHFAHNLMIPNGQDIVKRELTENTVSQMDDLSSDKFFMVRGTSSMFNDLIYERTVKYDHEFNLKIIDQFKTDSIQESILLWHFDKDKNIIIQKNYCFVLSKRQDKMMVMKFSETNFKSIELFTSATSPKAVRSTSYGVLEKAPYIEVKYTNGSEAIITDITFIPKLVLS